ncbi:MAG: NIPSNAP family protein [Verrucomicrobia bacterium]|nr:NIPSNAP family protein [Verrucomicrobiota bacterium]
MRIILACLASAISSAFAIYAADAPATSPARSPSLAKGSRCFEMRTYHATTGKLEELHLRFRAHTNALFIKHGIQIVAYWVPLDQGGNYEDKLVYVLAYPNRAAREKSWQAFLADADWIAAKNASEVNGKLVDKIESAFMTATDYSPIR